MSVVEVVKSVLSRYGLKLGQNQGSHCLVLPYERLYFTDIKEQKNKILFTMRYVRKEFISNGKFRTYQTRNLVCRSYEEVEKEVICFLEFIKSIDGLITKEGTSIEEKLNEIAKSFLGYELVKDVPVYNAMYQAYLLGKSEK
jgi:hypothetical protein